MNPWLTHALRLGHAIAKEYNIPLPWEKGDPITALSCEARHRRGSASYFCQRPAGHDGQHVHEDVGSWK